MQEALSEPGAIHSCYHTFHGYSLGNQFLAWGQCYSRGIKPGPIASYNKWKDLGRHVVKGQKALELCMPITVKKKDADGNEEGAFTRFVFRRNWFVLSQTDGAEYVAPAIKGFELDRALANLNITRETFQMLDGNTQGYATINRTIAINPVAAEPFKTTIHEIAHIVLGHCAEGSMSDRSQITPRDIRELEAEGTAYLVSAVLEQTSGLEFSRGYIQHWYKGAEVPERSAARIFKAADQILRAGRGDTGKAEG